MALYARAKSAGHTSLARCTRPEVKAHINALYAKAVSPTASFRPRRSVIMRNFRCAKFRWL
jgi:hypothetical protein